MADKTKPSLEKKTFESLLCLQATRGEVLAFYGLKSKTYLNEWIKKNYDGRTFEEMAAQYNTQGQISLRRKAYNMADKNPAVMIFLLKSVCHMSDDPTPATPENDKQVAAFTNAVKVAAKAITSCAGLVAGIPNQQAEKEEDAAVNAMIDDSEEQENDV